uniref:AMOP domain protein n=1 Tax=Strongyloides papillosus TaxID=174720 RepID=A0A0N5BZK0_STREA
MSLYIYLCIFLYLFLQNSSLIFSQQTYQEYSTVDLFGNKNPIYNYLPNPGHVDVKKLDEYLEQTDHRMEEGWWHLFPYGPLYHDASILTKTNHDRQIDFDFDFPFYGFRFNYTMIYPGGLLAFSDPEFIQPPYTFPNPRWPEQKDASFIAPFYADQQFQYIGEKGISNVWYRLVFRPRAYENFDEWGDPLMRNGNDKYSDMFRTPYDRYHKQKWGRVEDPYLLDNITMAIREGIIGAHGFRADYAVIVTWERMAYGGAPKITQVNKFEEAKRWTNTYQVVLATDEIRSYCIFNYAHINWTSSNTAGALQGRGGLQSAIAGFNAGNGTGWTPLPYSGEGRVLKLQEFSNVGVPGRWLYRVDEQIIPGGCSNESVGFMTTAPIAASMIGGVLVNVSGPCLRSGDVVKVIFDEYQVDCERLSMIRAQCILPVNKMFRTGLVQTRMSRDGGQSYPYVGTFYLLQPALAMPQVKLIDNPRESFNNWRSSNATKLRLEWAPYNLTNDINAQIDITLMGYWEDTDDHIFEEVGTLGLRLPNSGSFEFDPRTMARTHMVLDSWRRFSFGFVRVALSDQHESNGAFWSKMTPFGWYFRDVWEYEYGSDWALELCKDWFDYDGRRINYAMDLEPSVPCPCVLDQALLDIGRFMPLIGCDRDGDASCNYNKGAQHCVMSTGSTWTGAGQVCCYDFEGWLMHSDDYENAAHLRFFSPGTSQRSHPLGSYPFKRPPYVPSLSNYHTDVMAYEKCCKWAGNCEFYFWRRQTSGCQEYIPPVAGIAYGDPHFVTYDGTRYSFNGKGYFMLTMAKDSIHDFQVQVRMEQPPKTDWNQEVMGTVITGMAARENDSDIVQIFARKDHRRWRYRMDVVVNGYYCYFDTPELKLQKFKGVTLRSPERNHNQSEIHVMFESGVGIQVQEAHGVLSVMVLLPPQFNETYAFPRGHDYYGTGHDEYGRSTSNVRADFSDLLVPPSTLQYSAGIQRFVTVGLLGTFNDNHLDDLMSPDGQITIVNYPPTEQDNRNAYEFGRRWRIDGSKYKLLFQDHIKPIYDPLKFGNDYSYEPVFDPYRLQYNASLVFTLEEVRVACQNVYECEYDYFLTGRREIAMATLEVQKKLLELKEKGSKRKQSCGALLTGPGVIKYPPGNNYLDGVTVTFTCKPEYFIHGTPQRVCVNGTWSPGWWTWCRRRTLETGLKWITGVLSSTAILLFIASIFFACYLRRISLHPETKITLRRAESCGGLSRFAKSGRKDGGEDKFEDGNYISGRMSGEMYDSRLPGTIKSPIQSRRSVRIAQVPDIQVIPPSTESSQESRETYINQMIPSQRLVAFSGEAEIPQQPIRHYKMEERYEYEYYNGAFDDTENIQGPPLTLRHPHQSQFLGRETST